MKNPLTLIREAREKRAEQRADAAQEEKIRKIGFMGNRDQPLWAEEFHRNYLAGVNYRPIFTVSYDGEKNPGEIGDIKNLIPDHAAMRARSWQSYLSSDITQLVVNEYVDWIVGTGLTTQAKPIMEILEQAGVVLDRTEFSSNVNRRFRVFCNSKQSSWSKRMSIHQLARTCLKNSIVGGDVLLIMRPERKTMTVELVDGANVASPLFASKEFTEAKQRGNRITQGIEMTPSGEHVAYFIRKANDPLGFQRIEAKGRRSGQVMATLIVGKHYRIDHHRGIPLFVAVLETIAKLDRYKEATVGSAEERQKIVLQITHDELSTGANPLTKSAIAGLQIGQKVEQNNSTTHRIASPNHISASTQKQVYNMEPGSKLETLASDNELSFKDFFTTNINIVCAVLGIPPEVALKKYDSNFSASRAALKHWELKMKVMRKWLSDEFYQPIYNMFLLVQVANRIISAPGYLRIMNGDDAIDQGAYNNAVFIGPNVPHIDPVKEVKAEREKLGPLAKHVPLTTISRATESLNSGEFQDNMEQFDDEMDNLPDSVEAPPAPAMEPATEPAPADPV